MKDLSLEMKKGFLLVFGCLVCLLVTLPSVIGREDEEYDDTTDEPALEGWDKVVADLDDAFPNNDELELALLLVGQGNHKDLKKTFESLNGNHQFDTFLESVKTKNPTIYAKIQPLYEKKRAAYRSLGEGERKLLDELFSLLTRRLFDCYKNDGLEYLSVEEAAKWKKAFGALTDQQKDSIRSEFPLLTYYVRTAGKVTDVHGGWIESKLSSIIDDTAESGLFYEIVNEAKNTSDYRKWMEILKRKNETIYDQVKPLVARLEKGYQVLPTVPKAFVRQAFEWLFENRDAFVEDSYDNYFTDDQIQRLKTKYYALPRRPQKLVEFCFPFLIGRLKYRFELSIAKAFNKN